MKCMILGSVLAIAGTSAELIVNAEHLTQRDQMLVSFIFGSFGMLAVIGLYGAKSVQHAALHACAAIPLAGACAPSLAWVVAGACGLREPTLVLIAPVALGIGIGGPCLVRKYGDQLLDILGRWGLSNAKTALGQSDDNHEVKP